MLVVLGDSHTIALRDGLGKLNSRYVNAAKSCFGDIVIRDLSYGLKFFEPFFQVRDHEVHFTDPRAQSVLAKFPGGFSPIAQNDERTFMFCFGFHPSFLIHLKQWETHTASQSVIDKHYISEALISTSIKEHIKPMVEFFSCLQSMNVRFSIVSCCPLPKSFITDERRKRVTEEEILAFCKQYKKIFSVELDRLDIRYFSPPEETYNGQWLKEEFVNRKGIGDYHADEQYGSIMLQSIIDDYEKNRTPTLRSKLRFWRST